MERRNPLAQHAVAVMALVLLVGFASRAPADDSDLSHGALIPHFEPTLAFSQIPPPEGWCQAYRETNPVTHYDDLNPRIDDEGYVIWFLLAAWSEPKRLCGVEFGIGSYNEYIFMFDDWNCEPCFPSEGLEILSDGWPGPNEGIAFVPAGEPYWNGNFIPVYVFAGYCYSEYGPGSIPLSVNTYRPNPEDHRASFAYFPTDSTQLPPVEYEVECLGSLGLYQYGEICQPLLPEVYSYENGFPDQRYFLVSIPLSFSTGTRLSSVLADLGPPGERTWRGYDYHGLLSEPDPVVLPGHAYWIATREATAPLEIEGWALPDTVGVTLSPGWNTIGQPQLGATYPWNLVRVVAGEDTLSLCDLGVGAYVQSALYWFVDETPDLTNDGYYEARTPSCQIADPTWNPWGGYFIYAEQECLLLMPRTSSPVAIAPSTPPGDPNTSPEWEVRFTAQSADSRDRNLRLGFREESCAGIDHNDILKPPAIQSGVQLAIIQEGGSWDQYMHAYAPSDLPTVEWRLSVSGVSETVTISWCMEGALPENRSVCLIDPERNIALDLLAYNETSYAASSGTRELIVRASSKPFTGELWVPAPTSIHSVRPNPFSGELTIDYCLREAGPTRIRLYDAAGRYRATILDQLMNPGPAAVQWAPASEPMNPGVYFLRLESPAGRDIKRVLLIE